jgi:hypothetical protein
LEGPIYQTLAERWDGSLWTIVASPNISPAQQNVLFGVICTSPTECWAVGFYLAGDAGVVNAFFQTLIERWDGATWAIVTSPNTSPTQNNILYGVTCAAGWDCWTAGHYITTVPQTLTEHYTAPSPPPVPLNAVVSRKAHGSAGAFDIDLPLSGNSGIECRSGGSKGDYTMVFTFANTLTSVQRASVSNGIGDVTSSAIGSDAHQYLVNLTGVTNAQVITVSLANVYDSAGDGSSAVSATMGLLLGDVNASHRVDAADVSLVRQQTLQPVTSSNFREDINASGRIDAADVSIARQQTLTSLP